MPSESRSIFALQASRFLFATGKIPEPQGRPRSYPPPRAAITILQRLLPIRAPIAAANGSGTRINKGRA
jgi:hypothetical protein